MSAPEEEPHAGSESRKYQLGILFVHGIGEQPEGETLLRFGQPLVTWLHQWLARDAEPNARGSVEVVQAVLAPSKLQGDVPPHAEVHFDASAPGASGAPATGTVRVVADG